MDARIIVEAAKGGKSKVVCYDPQNSKVVDTGMKVADRPQDVDHIVKALKNTLERAGNRVDVLIR